MVNTNWISNELPNLLLPRDGMKIGPFGSQLKKEFLSEQGKYKVYGQENVYTNDFNLGTRYIDNAKFADLMSCELVSGDIVISTMGTIGQCSIVPDSIQPGIMDSHLIRLRLNTKVIDRLYLKYFIQSEQVQRQIKELSVGGIMDGLSTAIVKKIVVDYPPLHEQRRIAEALSDTDSLLGAMEKLIAKKRAIMQGAMQDLLTGKRRLHGFAGEWVNMNLVANSTLKARIGWQGLTTAEYLDSGYSYLITGTDLKNGRIAWDTCHYVDKPRYDQDTNIQVVNGDVLITKDGTIGKVAIVSGLNKKATLNSGVFVLRPKAGAYDHRFAYYVLLSHIFIDFLEKLAAGSTINHLYQKDFVNFELDVPPTIPEQSAIADILSDMDAEIDVLTAKLNKLRNIKQGMMSKLLTGHIHLKEQEAEATPEAVVVPKIIELPKHKPETTTTQTCGHNQQFDDAVMIAGIVNVIYSDKFPLGRKKVQKCLYLLRRHQDKSTAAFKKKAAGPYADEVRYKGGEPIALSSNYIITTTTKDKGTTFARGKNISQALGYIQSWGKQDDMKWVSDKLKYMKVDELELLATVDMAICDLTEAGTPICVNSIKHLIVTNEEWKAKLKKQTFNDTNIARAIHDLQTLL